MQHEKGLSRMPKRPSRASARGDAALARALTLVRGLRARAPGDHAQTRETLRPSLVEEALELDQALTHGAPAELRDELGDLLLHLAFQIVIGEERREFDAETVTRALEEKMWRPHPHLYWRSEEPGHQGWDRVQKRERGVDVGRAIWEELDRLWGEVKAAEGGSSRHGRQGA